MSGQSAVTAAMVCLVTVAVGTAAFLGGAAAGEEAEWRTGTARVMGEPSSPEVVITDDAGRDYATAGLVDWIDGHGTLHTGDRLPGCLRSLPLTHPEYGERTVLQFATADVDVDGVGSTRLVVAIDCRPAS